MSRPLSPLFALTLLVPAAAQGLVSPVSTASAEGNYDNSLPLGYGGAQQAYLQLHEDLAGRAGAFTRLAARRDGEYAANAGLVAKTVTASLWFDLPARLDATDPATRCRLRGRSHGGDRRSCLDSRHRESARTLSQCDSAWLRQEFARAPGG